MYAEGPTLIFIYVNQILGVKDIDFITAFGKILLNRKIISTIKINKDSFK